ncbi:MAG TPA: F0F1 ATP synthase subunit epsilon [Candidatus Acetothermia bacterium]|nr:F0F1 ATP synthase subunit epsilon [Candidatus Acetothermia bacterium]
MLSMECVLLEPTGSVFSGKARFVAAETTGGWVGILPRHAPAAFPMEGGLLRIRTSQGEHRYRVGQGVLWVEPRGVTILAERVEALDDEGTG